MEGEGGRGEDWRPIDGKEGREKEMSRRKQETGGGEEEIKDR